MYPEMVIISKSELVEIINVSIKQQLQELTKVEKPKNEELLSVEETCLFLKCSKTTLHKFKKDGLLQARRIGRRIFFLKEEIIESTKSNYNFKKRIKAY
ncbi:MAG: DNA-binding protein [Chitinophagaceae bacterium]|nr:DNA-binding protein [Chitinophagaceae bacterium]